MYITPAPLRRGFRWLPVNTIVRKGDHYHYIFRVFPSTGSEVSRLTVCEGSRVVSPKTYSRKRRYAARKP